MLVNLQNLDTSCSFCKLNSFKTLPTIGVSAPPPTGKQLPINKNKVRHEVSKKSHTVYRSKSTHDKKSAVILNPSSTLDDCKVKLSTGNVYMERVHTNCSANRVNRHVVEETVQVTKKLDSVYRRKPTHDKKKAIIHNPSSTHDDCKVNLSSGVVNGLAEKVHTKCSMKWVKGHGVVETLQVKRSTEWVGYGGCIPAILVALDKVSDLDEVFKPWEERLSSKGLTIILKEQRGWERAMEIFEWFKRKGCYEVNVIHYNVMARILGKAHRWGEVERLWEEMERRRIIPVNSTFGTLIDVYSKGGLRERAIHWLELMHEREIEPDEVTMSIVVQMYKKAGEFEKAEEFFKKWSVSKCVAESVKNSKPLKVAVLNGDSRSHVCLSPYTYNTLIDTYGKAGRLQDVSETFERMLREGTIPNIVTFNTMLHIFSNHGQLEEIESLMLKMEQLKCQPDTRTYSILIFLYAKHGSIEIAAGYFRKMKEASLHPDPVSYRILLYAFSMRHMVAEAEELVYEMDKGSLEIDEFTQSALTRMYIEAGMLENSWLWFKRFHLEGNMSSQCYSANIDAFGKRGHILEAEKVFMCSQEGRNPSVLEFNVMIHAYGINKRYDKACHLVDGMEKHGVVPGRCSYSSLIQILASANLPQTAMSYVRKMQDAGLVSDCIVYCTVISSFLRLGQLEIAVGVFKEMIRFNVQPDVVIYGVFINAYADIGNVEEALGHVSAMKERGLPMNHVIYKSLIKLYTKVGRLKEAEEVYHILQKLDVGPDVYSSNCLIHLYSERSMAKPAEEMFEKLKTTGDANEFSYAMMLCLYKKIGRFEEAIHVAEKMRELGLLTDLLSYNQLLGLYASYGRFKEVVTTLNEMIESSIHPNDSTFRALGDILIKRGVPKQAVAKLDIMWKRDNQSGLQAWMSTLDSVLGMVDHDFVTDLDE